jgi:transposase InsO family protein
MAAVVVMVVHSRRGLDVMHGVCARLGTPWLASSGRPTCRASAIYVLKRSQGSSATTVDGSSHAILRSFIRLTGVTHVRTSPYYPQSNGKLERWHGSLKRECIRPGAVASLGEAERRITSYVDHYNKARLHSASGYVTPADKLIGLEQVIFAERDRKLEEARERRRIARRSSREVA